jgi:hypothetical protein
MGSQNKFVDKPRRNQALHEVGTPNGYDWLSGYQDSNLGPPAPKAGALPDCATSRNQDSNLGPPAPNYRTALHPELVITSLLVMGKGK